ncbi:MAG: FAD-dependent thymidylate synthase [Candidatus Hadarchaeia archaeon]
MKVKLIDYTKNPDLVAGAAAHSCHSNKSAYEIMETEKDDKLKKILRKTMEMGHTSVIEHSKFTFSIKSISRACSHQLVRHRIASYSQQSQRYIEPKDKKYVTPKTITANAEAKEKFEKTMSEVWNAYNELSENEEIPIEDARFVLPNATKTNITVTMNSRSLHNFFELRTCTHAQWEIRELANKMLSKVRKKAPVTFESAGPPCRRRGVCPERDEDCELYDKYVS